MKPGETKWAARVLSEARAVLSRMTDQERVDFFDAITEDYCTECGQAETDQRCQCWNDE